MRSHTKNLRPAPTRRPVMMTSAAGPCRARQLSHRPIPVQPSSPLTWGEIPGIEWVLVSIMAIALTAMFAAVQVEQSNIAHQTQNNFNQHTPDGFGVSFVDASPHGQSHGGDDDPAITAP